LARPDRKGRGGLTAFAIAETPPQRYSAAHENARHLPETDAPRGHSLRRPSLPRQRLVLFWIWEPLGWIGLGLTVWCYYFFRDPKRAVPLNRGLMVSPADGVVSMIERAVPPAELGLGPLPLTAGLGLHVGLQLPCEPCAHHGHGHRRRLPAGQVPERLARQGVRRQRAQCDCHRAWRTAARSPSCRLPGLVARRIVCWGKPGQGLRTGERFGLIRFGSRLDIYLPEGVEPQVALGQTMIAGETVIAILGQAAPARVARME
jgi:phosphatidylserine decarboxylase